MEFFHLCACSNVVLKLAFGQFPSRFAKWEENTVQLHIYGSMKTLKMQYQSRVFQVLRVYTYIQYDILRPRKLNTEDQRESYIMQYYYT